MQKSDVKINNYDREICYDADTAVLILQFKKCELRKTGTFLLHF